MDDVLSAQDYYPFGMQMPGRSFSSENYIFGFNGQEKDDEVKGNGNSINYDARILDVRLGRFLSVDPLTVVKNAVKAEMGKKVEMTIDMVRAV